ncbi:MAG: DUF1858 domain-containing protein [Sulfurospirillaceae bacterium]|jgi:hypothetical protein|nr:DUF1858 domain-containing protein [Sulfurospirillaceae bacterium]
MEIDYEVKIADLLKTYPELEDFLVELNPRFQKLKNPILKRTLAKLATIKQAALLGNMEPIELLNALRQKKNQPLIVEKNEDKSKNQSKPSWLKKPDKIFNANEILNENNNPLAVINRALKSMEQEEVLRIDSDFLPSPLIEHMKNSGFEIYYKEKGDGFFETFILNSKKS